MALLYIQGQRAMAKDIRLYKSSRSWLKRSAIAFLVTLILLTEDRSGFSDTVWNPCADVVLIYSSTDVVRQHFVGCMY